MDINAIGRQFGLSEAQTRAALDALAPVVAAGMRRAAQSPQGLQEIFKSVLTGGFGGTLDDEDAVRLDRAKPVGDDILAQVFGNKDASREVAQRLSATSGIGAALLKKLLPIVTTIVMGALAKKMGSATAGTRGPPQADSGDGLGDVLKDVLGGGSGRSAQPAPQPEPSPQGRRSDNPLEDILSDILKGGTDGGRVIVKQIPSDQMGDILRDIFGGSLPGGPGGASVPPRRPSEDSVARGRKTLDDMLGGGSRTGNAADDLLNSVEEAVRRS